MGAVTIGVDIGQRVDPTAICVAEVEDRVNAAERYEAHYLIRHLERLPLGTNYPAVAKRTAAICASLLERLHSTPTLYIDATGVGQPIVDVLRDAKVRADLKAVYFTHGDRRTEENGEIKLGKAWLVSRLQALLQCERLHLPNTAEAKALAQELLDYEIRIDQDANDKYGAFKVGTHDDLVTALGLATQDEGAALPFGWLKL